MGAGRGFERILAIAIVAGILLGCVLVSNGETAPAYPTKAVTLIVPYPPGGRTDLCGRVVAQYLKDALG